MTLSHTVNAHLKAGVILVVTVYHKVFRDGEKGEGYGGGGRGRLYLSLHCNHQNSSSIKMGSDESRFNISLIVRGKVTR